MNTNSVDSLIMCPAKRPSRTTPAIWFFDIIPIKEISNNYKMPNHQLLIPKLIVSYINSWKALSFRSLIIPLTYLRREQPSLFCRYLVVHVIIVWALSSGTFRAIIIGSTFAETSSTFSSF